jgi:hypothetical protein
MGLHGPEDSMGIHRQSAVRGPLLRRPLLRRGVATRRRSGALAAAVVVGLVASGAFVWQSTSAAFTATTSNPSSSWATGSVAISDDDASAALFTATGLVPGSTGTKCIVVTYSGTIAAAGVKLYAASSVDSSNLAQYVNLTIEEGTGGTFAGGCGSFVLGTNVYTGTLANFNTTKTSYLSGGVGTWAPTGATQTKVYKFTYTLNAATPSTGFQGVTASTVFQWEAQS